MQERDVPRILDQEEQEALINVFNTRRGSQARNYAMIVLMLRTGLRVSEVCNLKFKDIDFDKQSIRVNRSKRGKSRKVYFNGDVSEAMELWLKRRKDYVNAEDYTEDALDYVFVTYNDNKVSESTVRKVMSNYSEKAGIDWSPSPHTLRHTFAAELLRETNLPTVKKALGHDDIEVTQIYTEVVDDTLREAMQGL